MEPPECKTCKKKQWNHTCLGQKGMTDQQRRLLEKQKPKRPKPKTGRSYPAN